jgi:hypothetical protein
MKKMTPENIHDLIIFCLSYLLGSLCISVISLGLIKRNWAGVAYSFTFALGCLFAALSIVCFYASFS